MQYVSLSALIALLMATPLVAANLLPGFEKTGWFDEQTREVRTPTGIRMVINAPLAVNPRNPTLVIFYATPNGNTIEHTMGCATSPDLDWHFDIQHIAAQTRVFRNLDKARNVVLVCMEAEGLSWPTWRGKHSDNAAIIRNTITTVLRDMPGKQVSAVIAGHSGGGSMISGFLNGCDSIPAWVERIVYLDANYSYSDEEKHGDKLLAWLRGGSTRRLVVIAYDDREIELNGKKVVGPTGGTFRATHRMLDRFRKDLEIKQGTRDPFVTYSLLGGRISIYIHPNPENKILHTALVGDMNGYLHALTFGTPYEGKWGKFGGPRAYTRWIQPSPLSKDVLPARPATADGGRAIMRRISSLPLAERESVIVNELKKGNFPVFLRSFVAIHTTSSDTNGKKHDVVCYVMPDYLSVGSDTDFVRVPITPMAAQAIADAFGCTLPTRKMVDDVYAQAQVRLEPKPLTENRETVETFIQHNSIIESQRAGKPLGSLVAGIKKDVVLTNLPADRKDHVAIYGWHKLDGTPIQPLTSVHINTYVDYSHGVRLVKRTALVDGNPRDIRDILTDPILHPLLSDEGPIAEPYYGQKPHGSPTANPKSF